MNAVVSLPGWRAMRWVLATLGALLAACAVHAVAGFDAGPLAWLLEKWGYNVVLVGSGLACLARGIKVREERAAWLTMGVGVVGWALGNVYYTVVLWDLDPILIPSVSDVLWLGYYPIVYVAVAMLLRARIARFHASLWVDGALAALAVAALSAAVVFQSVLQSTGGEPIEVATNLAYPLGDLVLLGMVTGGVALTGWKPGRTWGALAFSFIIFGVSDGIYLWGNATGSWQAGSVFEAGWPAATLLLAWAAWMPPRHVRPRPLEGRRTLVVPTLFALLGLTLLISDHFSRLNLLAVALAWASLLAVIGRFGMTFFANLTMLADSRSEALTDALTGLGNRRRLMRDLEDALHPEDRTPCALVLYDLNGFKGYNDVFGHPAGDALLARLGARLGDAVSPDARAYRMGGDEFCVSRRRRRQPARPARARPAGARRASATASRSAPRTAACSCPRRPTTPPTALGLADRRMYAQKDARPPVGGRAEPRRAAQGARGHHPDLGDHVHDVGLARRGGRGGARPRRPAARPVRPRGRAPRHRQDRRPQPILDKPGPAGRRRVGVHRPPHALRRAHPRRRDRAAPRRQARPLEPRALGRQRLPRRPGRQEIPLGARIVTACDAYDAMTSDRPYRARSATGEALAELRRCAGTQFDPAVVDAFCRVSLRATADAAE